MILTPLFGFSISSLMKLNLLSQRLQEWFQLKSLLSVKVLKHQNTSITKSLTLKTFSEERKQISQLLFKKVSPQLRQYLRNKAEIEMGMMMICLLVCIKSAISSILWKIIPHILHL